MPQSTASVTTPLAARYLTQLCKHFEHKMPVTHGNGEGQITFSSGTCTLDAKDDQLTLRMQAGDPAIVARLQDVVERHLARFAFREPLTLQWHAAENASAN